jgi:hypothetical protein
MPNDIKLQNDIKNKFLNFFYMKYLNERKHKTMKGSIMGGHSKFQSSHNQCTCINHDILVFLCQKNHDSI